MSPPKKELEATIDPEIPFRVIEGHRHHTWARTFHCYPEKYLQPQSLPELKKIVKLAQKYRRRIVTVGCGHSPSDLTCTSQWMVNLDHYDLITDLNAESGVVVMQAGIRLHQLKDVLRDHGLAMPNYGSIDFQSIAGAISTATHGSSVRHGLLSQSVLELKLLLANGEIVTCGPNHCEDLFRAALVSLGALGIIVEVTFQAIPSFNIEWKQSLLPLNNILQSWNEGLWTEQEFVRIWWMPYMKKVIRWSADKTGKPPNSAPKSAWKALLGYHAYQSLMYIAHWVPSILPIIEKVVLYLQYGAKEGTSNSGVDEDRTGLLMNCMFSQFVNEWAIPLAKGPEALSRISAWLNHDEPSSGIPFSSHGIYVHAPIEVRVSDTTNVSPRPFLDGSVPDGPTLYLNFTLYRPYGTDPPCRERYYEACEWLMKNMGGRPHWAKNFSTVTREDFHRMYPDMTRWLKIRNDHDPNGMFLGDWHQRHLIPADKLCTEMPLAERINDTRIAKEGGVNWAGVQVNQASSSRVSHTSEESFDMVQGLESEKFSC